MSPDTAVAAVTLLASGLKSSQPPPGDTTVPAATVKRETDNSPTDLGELGQKFLISHEIPTTECTDRILFTSDENIFNVFYSEQKKLLNTNLCKAGAGCFHL